MCEVIRVAIVSQILQEKLAPSHHEALQEFLLALDHGIMAGIVRQLALLKTEL